MLKASIEVFRLDSEVQSQDVLTGGGGVGVCVCGFGSCFFLERGRGSSMLSQFAGAEEEAAIAQRRRRREQ